MPIGRDPHGPVRWAWLLLAYLSLALAAAGVVLPLLPTVPFVLLAAYAAARGSKHLHQRLLTHRVFGPMIRDWQRHGAVSRRAKWLASASMLLAAAIAFLTAPHLWIAAIATATMAVIACWLWLRPEPER
ncbi:YbaN family protein [Novilysobacter antarcticus]|uniref:YbaN family protein n=1 Tax=Novilysobacter antarcticus TaxID=2862543 RepID=UPI001C991B72|nr:YbaN family protein [Lysobacter antarcticus]